MISMLINLYRGASGLLSASSSVIDLIFRLWVANVFFKSGLTKIGNWDATLYLFENEYTVPLLPTDIAAYVGTATELTLPWLLAVGLATRPTALALFVFNIIAATSYPGLSEAGMHEHMYWGLMLLVTLFHGPGALSVDHLIKIRWFAPRQSGVMSWPI